VDDQNDIAALGRLIRQRGVPERPQAIEQVSEVRSDAFVKLPQVMEAHAGFTLAAVIIEWRFRLPYEKVGALHDFLVANERFIADGCETTMNGVHYRGTYMALDGQRAAYATIWGYDNWEAQHEWSKVLNDQRSRFYRAVRDLRAYWLSDPNGTQEHFGAAAGIDLRQGFFGLTLDAAGAGPGGGGAAPRKKARGRAGS
jgi:hypothetical protein